MFKVNEMYVDNQDGFVVVDLVFIDQNLDNEKNEVCGKKNSTKDVNVKVEVEVTLEVVFDHGI